jgi:transposase
MEDKTFELLTKMYSDFSEFRKETSQRFDKAESEIKTVGNQVVKLENDHGQKLDSLFDGYRQLTEGQEFIKSQLAALSAKVDSQDVQITVLKGNKKAVK